MAVQLNINYFSHKTKKKDYEQPFMTFKLYNLTEFPTVYMEFSILSNHPVR